MQVKDYSVGNRFQRTIFWGDWLNLMLVKEAHKEEMEEFNKHRVYTKVPLSECY